MDTNVNVNQVLVYLPFILGERGGSVVECRTPEREVRGSRPTSAVLCPWARHFTPRKYWLITQEAMAQSRYDWKIVDWDVKPQHNQPTTIYFKKFYVYFFNKTKWVLKSYTYIISQHGEVFLMSLLKQNIWYNLNINIM